MPRGGSSGSSGRSSGGGGGRSGGGGGRSGGSIPSRSGGTYVNNASNRSAGRVGMAYGTAVISSGTSSSSSSSSRTYVDNASNRSLGRVGMEHGTAVVSKGASSSVSDNAVKTYADNDYNRHHDRVGKEHGTAVISKNASNLSFEVDPKMKVYKDNSLNRTLGRVGKTVGTAVHTKNAPGSVTTKKYADTTFNRKQGRVGKPLGSMPISRKSTNTAAIARINELLRRNPDDECDFISGLNEEDEYYVTDTVQGILRREKEVYEWQEEMKTSSQPYTSEEVLNNFKGNKIDFKEICLGKQIGNGGFGDVFFAKWKGSVVAVKKLRVQQVSARKQKEFTDEVMLFCDLDHPNVVKFIGACVIPNDLCIVMEYMQMSLFEALHIKTDIEFTENEKIKIIKQTSAGLQYLHAKHIAHRDMKTQNVLIDHSPEKSILTKLTDFGLSMIKNDTGTSMSESRQYTKNVGTPKYAAPENLRGESLNLESLKMADIYSLSLIGFEVVFEEEPFYNLNLTQLMKQVGEQGVTPDIPDEVPVDENIINLIKSCWNRDATGRPSAKQFTDKLSLIRYIYKEL
ncbi:uncharacterized protein LOC134719596 [Mytilus trossulus]|uniref:uncharacterized protein LOC134719596 n=1 Tax=Mytilus trossulus TaxID=6551 RepID=UPI003007A822